MDDGTTMTMPDNVIWHIAMNPRKLPCGCREWEQWSAKAHAWVHKTFRSMTCNEDH